MKKKDDGPKKKEYDDEDIDDPCVFLPEVYDYPAKRKDKKTKKKEKEPSYSVQKQQVSSKPASSG